MIETLIRNYVRYILLENAPFTHGNMALSAMDANSMQTPDDTQFTYEDSPEVDIDIFPTSDGMTHVKISSLIDDKLSSPERVFSNEEEARAFARSFVEKHNRIMMAQESN
jgi:hypothetical protein